MEAEKYASQWLDVSSGACFLLLHHLSHSKNWCTPSMSGLGPDESQRLRLAILLLFKSNIQMQLALSNFILTLNICSAMPIQRSLLESTLITYFCCIDEAFAARYITELDPDKERASFYSYLRHQELQKRLSQLRAKGLLGLVGKEARTRLYPGYSSATHFTSFGRLIAQNKLPDGSVQVSSSEVSNGLTREIAGHTVDLSFEFLAQMLHLVMHSEAFSTKEGGAASHIAHHCVLAYGNSLVSGELYEVITGKGWD